MLCQNLGHCLNKFLQVVFRSRSRSESRFSGWSRRRYFLPGAEKKSRAGAGEKLLGSTTLVIMYCILQGSNTLPRAGQLRRHHSHLNPANLPESEIVITKKLTGMTVGATLSCQFIRYRYPVARNGFWIIFFFKFYFFVLHLGKRQTTYICLKPKIDPPYFFGVQQKVTGYTYTTPTQCQLPVQYRYSIKIEIIRQQLHPNIIFLGSLSMGRIFPKNFVKKEL